MPDPQNEVACPCGTVHYDYPAKLCRACKADREQERADAKEVCQ